MSKITASMVGELRGRTGAALMDCKKALVETAGDFEKAIDWLREKGIAKAAKKAGREASEGAVVSYIHGAGRVGVMVELNCETDFVATNEDFKSFGRDIAMHIAAASPLCVSREEVDPVLVQKERDLAASQSEGRPAHAVEKIVEGKINKFFQEVCLLEQPFVKDQDHTVQEVLNQKIATIGENIIIRRFARFELGA